jgi:hypothetical protein
MGSSAAPELISIFPRLITPHEGDVPRGALGPGFACVTPDASEAE